MHIYGEWSDKLFNDVEEAAHFIGSYLVKYGRVGIRQTKEKYGTARVYLIFGWHQLHSVIYPRYVYSQFPDWLWTIDCRVFSRVFIPINLIAVPYHKWLYRRSYKKAIHKFPHIREEILSGADYSELLKGL